MQKISSSLIFVVLFPRTLKNSSQCLGTFWLLLGLSLILVSLHINTNYMAFGGLLDMFLRMTENGIIVSVWYAILGLLPLVHLDCSHPDLSCVPFFLMCIDCIDVIACKDIISIGFFFLMCRLSLIWSLFWKV
eukprot:TRINITY_DN17143_c0_g1_i1.p1 TRINITY_DN17143_c0_g1~~TRINITY_DN17143_c0_g1_i1.p1  ORF type:complete len:133 (+),score=1.31 TRINITY_DN17143_c0_g1_i1:87-485(+)